MNWTGTGRLAFFAFIILHSSFCLRVQGQTGYTVTARGPDWKELAKTNVVNGTNKISRYIELATGLNYTNASGQLVESSEQITILPGGGAIANHGRHTVSFPGNIYNGVLEVVTPDGRHLQSRPLGVSYDDGSNTVFIATLKSAVGYLTSSNTVTYRDAFTGFRADLVCTYRRGGFECDLVFRQQPPTPGDYGLDESYSTLNMVTEFFNTQDPQQIPAGYDDNFGLQDVTLKFGKLTMTHGKAFAFRGTNNASSRPLGGESQREGVAPVYKTWLHSGGRTFLIESVPVLNLADDLNALPLTARSEKSEGRMQKLQTARVAPEVVPDSKLKTKNSKLARYFPALPAPTVCTNQIELVLADWKAEPGVVLDYTTVDQDQNSAYTFQGGGTYLISAPVWIGGPNANDTNVIFQGGAVIKFTGSGQIMLNSYPVCQTTVDQPAIFTTKDDNSVGQTIAGSTGNPADSQGATYLACVSNLGGNGLHDLRFYYAGTAMESSDVVAVSNCEFYHCWCINFQDFGNFYLDNCLIVDGCAWFNGSTFAGADSMVVHLQNVTCDNGYWGMFLDYNNFDTIQFSVKNSIFTGTFSWDALDSSDSTDSYEQVSAGNFTAAANAHHYLAVGSSFHNAASVGFAPVSSLTTYAPQDGGAPDTTGKDLGYHYPVNEDSDHDGLPDWWEWQYFGDFSHTGADLGLNGIPLSQSYSGGLNPHVPFSPPGNGAFANGFKIYLAEPRPRNYIP